MEKGKKTDYRGCLVLVRRKKNVDKGGKKNRKSLSFLLLRVSNLFLKLLFFEPFFPNFFTLPPLPTGFKCANHSCNIASQGRRSLRQSRANNSRMARNRSSISWFLFFYYSPPPHRTHSKEKNDDGSITSSRFLANRCAFDSEWNQMKKEVENPLFSSLYWNDFSA